MSKKIIITVLLIFVLKPDFFSGLDSLISRLKNAKTDSARIEAYYKSVIIKKNPEKLTDSLLQEILKFGNSKNCFVAAYSFYKVGYYYAQRENPGKALDNLFAGLKIADICKNKTAVMLIRTKIAFVNKVNDNFKVAILNSHIALSYSKALKDSFTMAENYTLLGNIYKSEMKLDSALLYHELALKLREVRNDPTMMAITYNNLGLVYKNKNDHDKALFYLRKSLVLKQKLKDKTISAAYNNMSLVFKRKGMLDSTIFYSQKVVLEGLKYKNGKILNEGLVSLAEVYYAKKDMPKALYYYRRLREAEDSVNKETISAQYAEMQSKYESDKKDSELKQQQDTINLAATRNSMKNILIIISCVALGMAIVAVIFVFRSYRQTKKNAKDLSQKNKLIGEKNKEITDSINYAKNIQQSLLTSENVFKDNLKDFFILFMPKDIVSGDFYWAQKIEDEFVVICADCTGHGVPGAFMSLLAISNLKEITFHKKILRPDLILNNLRRYFIDSFSLSNNKDGMDASLIKIKGLHMETAAANNPIWIIRNGENMVIKPNKFPIGKHHGEVDDFSLNEFQLKENDLVMMFTDGYADQFGGPKNKKFKYKKMEQLIISKSNLPLDELKKIMEDEIKSWKGRNEQLDDILLLGIRI